MMHINGAMAQHQVKLSFLSVFNDNTLANTTEWAQLHLHMQSLSTSSSGFHCLVYMKLILFSLDGGCWHTGRIQAVFLAVNIEVADVVGMVGLKEESLIPPQLDSSVNDRMKGTFPPPLLNR